jgi:hypothetical protein
MSVLLLKLKKGLPALSLLLVMPWVFGGSVPTSAFGPSYARGINMNVAYEPIIHLHVPTAFTLSVTSTFRNTGQFSIRVENKLSDTFSISQIDPKPISTRVDKGGTTYFFSAIKSNVIIFTLIPKSIGRTSITFQYGVDTPVAFSVTTAL